MTQGYPHRETTRSLAPLSSEGLTLFDWNLSLAVRLRIPGVNVWSGRATAALPPEMLSSSHGSGNDDLQFTEYHDQPLNGGKHVTGRRHGTSAPSQTSNNMTGEWRCPNGRLLGVSEESWVALPSRNSIPDPFHSNGDTLGRSEQQTDPSGRESYIRKSLIIEPSEGEMETREEEASIFVLSRTVPCIIRDNCPPVDLTVKFRFDEFKLDITISCPYWVMNLTSLSLKYVPSSLPVSTSSTSTAFDTLQLPPCEAFNQVHLDHSTADDQTDQQPSISAVTGLFDSSFVFSKYRALAISRMCAEQTKSILQSIENQIPQLTSQIHDGFRVESDAYGSSNRCDLSIHSEAHISPDGADPIEVLERSSLVSLSKAAGPIIQQAIRIQSSVCSVSYIKLDEF